MELQIDRANAVCWEAIDELPGRPLVTVAHLVTAALRHRPDRIIIGEVRDHSAYDMLQAMNTGHSGSMTTTHADSALLALNRIADLALSAHSNLDHEFVRSQTADALHYVLQVCRERDGKVAITNYHAFKLSDRLGISRVAGPAPRPGRTARHRRGRRPDDPAGHAQSYGREKHLGAE
ncbi:MAG TPA: ATPase, T2SS/T4P/T4SS family [Bryobacteraceae bacterium]|nr:ATPase, T2SS/T4P/T4SS family [Bryobacteraceae bacterium]